MKSILAIVLLFVGLSAHAQSSTVNNATVRTIQFKTTTAPMVIASGGTTTPYMYMGGGFLTGIQIPAAFTSTTLTFLAAPTAAGPFQPVYTTAGTALSLTVAAGRYQAVDPINFYGVNYLEIVSGSAEAAARTLVISVKGY